MKKIWKLGNLFKMIKMMKRIFNFMMTGMKMEMLKKIIMYKQKRKNKKKKAKITMMKKKMKKKQRTRMRMRQTKIGVRVSKLIKIIKKIRKILMRV